MPKVEIGKYVLIRTYSAGVHFGILEKMDGKNAVLRNSIRIYYWEGACSLSQIAVDGVQSPENCKFTVPVPQVILTEVIEYLSVTNKAIRSITGVKPWKI